MSINPLLPNTAPKYLSSVRIYSGATEQDRKGKQKRKPKKKTKARTKGTRPQKKEKRNGSKSSINQEFVFVAARECELGFVFEFILSELELEIKVESKPDVNSKPNSNADSNANKI